MTTVTGRPTGRGVHILLVEDDPAEARLAREVLDEAAGPNRLEVARTGPEALALLRAASPARPDRVVLDLGLPGMGGLEVLAVLRADPALAAIPVAILTTSAAEADVARARELRAAAYVTKPVDLQQFTDVLGSLAALAREGA